jgi:transposase-like protein
MNQQIGKEVHSEQSRIEAVQLAKVIGVPRAAKSLRIAESTLYAWLRSLGEKSPSVRERRRYSGALRRYAVELAKDHEVAEVSQQTGVHPRTLVQWLNEEGLESPRRKCVKYSAETKKAAIELLAANNGAKRIVITTMGIPPSTLSNWWIEYKRALGELGGPKIARQYNDEEKKKAVATAMREGIAAAAKALGVSHHSVGTWIRAAGYQSPARFKPSKAGDREFRWMELECPDLHAWRALCVGWTTTLNSGLANKLGTLQRFVLRYLHIEARKFVDVTSPAAFLSRSASLPSYITIHHTRSRSTFVDNNVIHEFLQWVLLHEFSEPDDFGRPVISPAFHNPVPRLNYGASVKPVESVYSALPYGYLEDCRFALAQGPNFRDWTWAQASFSRVAGDWFIVDRSLVDEDDLDCVWRLRRPNIKSGRVITEMWSPVRWVCLLIKLILPLRTHQARMLDSGEADYWRVDLDLDSKVTWSVNKSPLREGTVRSPLTQGVFRRIQNADINLNAEDQVEIYINTNKTADRGRSGSGKGYTLPWLLGGQQHLDPYYWMLKLRRWQEKYNPIQSRTSWSELTHRHMAIKSDVALAGYPDACFLFRAAEARNPRERHLPITDSSITNAWSALLANLEVRLAIRGERHADGRQITFFKEANESDFRATHFPLHSLRVSLLTALALDGKVPFSILQKIAGHSRLLMTLYYTKPGRTRVISELKEAAERLDSVKEESIISFLREADYEQMAERAIAVDGASLATLLPMHPASRNVVGWAPMHHGLCMVGGNVSPIEDNSLTGGCYNGGHKQGSSDKPEYGPVPGGARNCVRCRFFVTEPHYLPALIAHMRTNLFHFDTARDECVAVDSELNAIRAQRYELESLGKEFAQVRQLKALERQWEAAMSRFNSRAEDVAACHRLIQRCLNLLEKRDKENLPQQFLTLTVGGANEFEAKVEEVGSELMQLAGVCEAYELYPDEQPGTAVLRQSQILDAALVREGLPPVLLLLNEKEQLLVGNALLRKMAEANSPDNVPSGYKAVIGAIDSGQGLSSYLKRPLSSIVLDCRKGLRAPTALPNA